jgi:bifunctional N-acetylglucosamine-1-phosphate-uridyltransferase/glucosamine-1-phosphate-acetyltransferase GlmU-like protein
MSYVLTKGLASNTETVTVNTVKAKNDNTLVLSGTNVNTTANFGVSGDVVIDGDVHIGADISLDDNLVVGGNLTSRW